MGFRHQVANQKCTGLFIPLPPTSLPILQDKKEATDWFAKLEKPLSKSTVTLDYKDQFKDARVAAWAMLDITTKDVTMTPLTCVVSSMSQDEAKKEAELQFDKNEFATACILKMREFGYD